MTLLELRRAVDSALAFPPDRAALPVVVEARSYGPEVGGHECVEAQSAGIGIDWNAGRFAIQPSEQLYRNLETLQAAANFAHHVREIIYGMNQDKGRNKNANAIREIVEGLDKWLPGRHEKGGRGRLWRTVPTPPAPPCPRCFGRGRSQGWLGTDVYTVCPQCGGKGGA